MPINPVEGDSFMNFLLRFFLCQRENFSPELGIMRRVFGYHKLDMYKKASHMSHDSWKIDGLRGWGGGRCVINTLARLNLKIGQKEIRKGVINHSHIPRYPDPSPLSLSPWCHCSRFHLWWVSE